MTLMKSRQIRIIGGRWRGRKLSVIDSEGLRPTPDRIRETIFNWLAADCPSASVLDCFAGSGVLGFEALSRGAGYVVAFEADSQAARSLHKQAEKLNTGDIEIIQGDVIRLIQGISRKFDMIFIDPPYTKPHLREQIFRQLELQQLLNENAKIVFEWPKSMVFQLPSDNLQWLKQKSAGQVNYAIAVWQVTG